jgi:pimeloyl-ACP methyl ester carboxylesterase
MTSPTAALERIRPSIRSSAVLVCDPQQGDWTSLSRAILGWGVPVHLFDFGPRGLARPDGRAPANAAAAMLARLEGHEAPVHLVGRGLGAAIALDVARRRASRIASLTLVDPCALQLLRPAGSFLSCAMRLDVLRRTGFRLLLVETRGVAPEIAAATRRVRAAAGRGSFRIAGQDGAASAADVWREVIGAVVEQIGVGRERPAPVLAAAA